MVAIKVLICSHVFIYLSALDYFENCLILIYTDIFYPILGGILVLLLSSILLLNKNFSILPRYRWPGLTRLPARASEACLHSSHTY